MPNAPVIDIKVYPDEYVPGVESLLPGKPFMYDMTMMAEPPEFLKMGPPSPRDEGKQWRMARFGISMFNNSNVPWVFGNPWKGEPPTWVGTRNYFVAAQIWKLELSGKGTTWEFPGYLVIFGQQTTVPGMPPPPRPKGDFGLLPFHYTAGEPWIDYAVLDFSQVADNEVDPNTGRVLLSDAYDARFTLNPDKLGGANSVIFDFKLGVNAMRLEFPGELETYIQNNA